MTATLTEETVTAQNLTEGDYLDLAPVFERLKVLNPGCVRAQDQDMAGFEYATCEGVSHQPGEGVLVYNDQCNVFVPEDMPILVQKLY